jgi:hypothetical protein
MVPVNTVSTYIKLLINMLVLVTVGNHLYYFNENSRSPLLQAANNLLGSLQNRSSGSSSGSGGYSSRPGTNFPLSSILDISRFSLHIFLTFMIIKFEVPLPWDLLDHQFLR